MPEDLERKKLVEAAPYAAFNLNDIIRTFPETANTLLIDQRLTMRPAHACFVCTGQRLPIITRAAGRWPHPPKELAASAAAESGLPGSEVP
ncbi:hypothetical protein [Ensifer canadensis]